MNIKNARMRRLQESSVCLSTFAIETESEAHRMY